MIVPLFLEANYLHIEANYLHIEANYLHINISKSKYIHFHPPRKKSRLMTDGPKFGDTALESVENIKFLGVTIDNKVNWKKHIISVTNKVRCSIAQLYGMRRIIPKDLKISVYNAIVNSQLSYAIPVWGGFATNDSLKPLFIVQKRHLEISFVSNECQNIFQVILKAHSMIYRFCQFITFIAT